MLIRRLPELWRPPPGLLARDCLRGKHSLILPGRDKIIRPRWAFGAPTSLAAATTALSGTTLVIGSQTIAAGTLVNVSAIVNGGASGPNLTIADQAGNTWIGGTGYFTQMGAAGHRVRTYSWFSMIVNALSSQSITVTCNVTIVNGVCRGFKQTGIDTTTPEDTGFLNTNSAPATTTPTVTSLAAATQSGEYNWVTYGSWRATNAFSYTEDASWTVAGNKDSTGSGGDWVSLSSAWRNDTAAGTVTHAPVTDSALYGQIIQSFYPLITDDLYAQACM